MMMPSGSMMTTATLTMSLGRDIENEYALITRASVSAVAIFANSTGCILTSPNWNHALAPLTSRPKSSAATSSRRPPM